MASSTATKKKKATKLNIAPLSDRVVIQPEEAAERTAGGIYLPDNAQEKPLQGKIVAVGPGLLNKDGERVALSVSVGDTVIYASYAGTEVKIDGVDYKIARESDLLAVID